MHLYKNESTIYHVSLNIYLYFMQLHLQHHVVMRIGTYTKRINSKDYWNLFKSMKGNLLYVPTYINLFYFFN